MLGEKKQIGVGLEDDGGSVNRGTGEEKRGREVDDERRRRTGGQVGLEEAEGGGTGREDREKKQGSAVNERWRMTMPSNPTSPVPTSRALAQQRFNQVFIVLFHALLLSFGPSRCVRFLASLRDMSTFCCNLAFSEYVVRPSLFFYNDCIALSPAFRRLVYAQKIFCPGSTIQNFVSSSR